jgi:glycyl-tRNA synthetase beta chain
MVGEFPELQGVIGGYIAEAQGEPQPVADAIRNHYKPVGQGDEVPTAAATVAVALADKLDTLIGFFGAQMSPTGSKDPYGLRRAALAVISILIENHLRLSIRPFYTMALGDHVQRYVYAEMRKVADPDAQTLVRAGTSPHLVTDPRYIAQFLARPEIKEFVDGFGSGGEVLLHFFADRLNVQQREAGVRHDLIDAVFALGNEDDLVRLLARVKALQKFVETDDGSDLLTAYKRAANILKKEDWTGAVMSSPETQGIPQTGEEDPLVLVDDPIVGEAVAEMASGQAGAELPEEKALIAALNGAEPKASTAIDKEDFTAAMAALATLRRPTDEFFDHVTVNHPDPGKRERRLNLLMRFRDALNRVADFSKIDG